MVSPTISSPVCQEQLIEAGKLVDRSVESCVQACLSATEDGELLKQVSGVNLQINAALSFTNITRKMCKKLSVCSDQTASVFFRKYIQCEH